MDVDVPLLLRFEALATLAIHSVLPSFTIGLASWLAVLEGLWLAVGNETFRHLYRTWIPVFAAVFGAAVVAALATPPGSQLVLVLELIAFVLEAILLLAILFGWPAHARRSHFIATLVLAVGSVLFALVWPGAQIPDHLPRLLLSAYLATALLVAAVAAWQLMSDPQDDAACIAQKMAVGMFVACAPLMIALDAAPQLRLGVWVGGAVLLVGLWGGLLIWRGSPERSQVFLAACVGMAPASLFSAGVGWVGQ